MEKNRLLESLADLISRFTSKLDKHQQYSLVCPLVYAAAFIILGFAIAAIGEITGSGGQCAVPVVLIGVGVDAVFAVYSCLLWGRGLAAGRRATALPNSSSSNTGGKIPC